MEPITKTQSKKIDFTGDCLQMRKLTNKFCKNKRIPLYKLPQFAKNALMYYLTREIEELFSYLLDTMHSNFCEFISIGKDNTCWEVPDEMEIDETCKCYDQ